MVLLVKTDLVLLIYISIITGTSSFLDFNLSIYVLVSTPIHEVCRKLCDYILNPKSVMVTMKNYIDARIMGYRNKMEW